MPAPFLIAPMLISLSLIGTPVTDTRMVLDNLSAPVTGTSEAIQTLPAKLEPAELKAPELETPEVETTDPQAISPPLRGISVELECLAYPDGSVTRCAVVSETRPGLGFGAAAVALMDGASIGPDAARGASGPVKFRHTIKFTPD